MKQLLAFLLGLGMIGASFALTQEDPPTPVPENKSAQETKPEPKQEPAQEPKPEPKKENKAEPKKSVRLTVQVHVLGDGQDVAGATVRLKAADASYDQEKQTNARGIATFQSVPRGKVAVQVTATSWSSFGAQYAVATEGQSLDIALSKQ